MAEKRVEAMRVPVPKCTAVHRCAGSMPMATMSGAASCEATWRSNSARVVKRESVSTRTSKGARAPSLRSAAS